MSRVRFIGPEPVTVPELGDRAVQPDEVVEVPDERYWGYACQSGVWEEVEPPADFVPPGSEPEQPPVGVEPGTEPEPVAVQRKTAPAVRKSAPAPQTEEG
jgi:hypothetical protein